MESAANSAAMGVLCLDRRRSGCNRLLCRGQAAIMWVHEWCMLVEEEHEGKRLPEGDGRTGGEGVGWGSGSGEGDALRPGPRGHPAVGQGVGPHCRKNGAEWGR